MPESPSAALSFAHLTPETKGMNEHGCNFFIHSGDNLRAAVRKHCLGLLPEHNFYDLCVKAKKIKNKIKCLEVTSGRAKKYLK